MKIDDLTVKQLREIREMTNHAGQSHGYKIGANYLIRTATYAQTGRLVAVYEKELVLEDAAWIANTGRFSDVLKTCDFKEVEPFPKGRQVLVGRGALIDAVEIDILPMVQK